MHATVAHIDDLPVGTLRMVRVGDRRICLVRTSDGVHALDNACPHEGYGLTQGTLKDSVLTCAWHNWKFDVTDGRCVLGEEDIRTHTVSVDADGSIVVTLVQPDPAQARPHLLDSLRRGIGSDYVGQVARDVVRLLAIDANPGELVWEALAHGLPRSEFGWGHSVASATDCLSMLDDGITFTGDARAMPIVQAIAGIAEEARDRPIQCLPEPVAATAKSRSAFLALVEAEQSADAQALVRGAIHAGLGAEELRGWFTGAVGAHLLSYGHGAIYAQKAFQLLEHIGWDRAETVLPHLVPTIVYATREDKLPYMRPFMRSLSGVDLASLAETGVQEGWSDQGELLHALLDTSDRTLALQHAVVALTDGAGVDALLDVVVEAVSRRMLRYDTAGEFDLSDDFGWLDITHGITYANAARWHNAWSAGPDTVRLALFCVFLAHWTGRHEWHTSIGEPAEITLASNDLLTAGRALQHESLLDRTSTFIVHAHGVKLSVAATEEAVRSGNPHALQATARFLQSPRLERFVARTVQQSIDFLSGRAPRDS